MRVAIVGYGAVSNVHAAQLRRGGVSLSAVCGPDRAKAEVFAAAHGFERAATDLEGALEKSDAVIIASPSPAHFEQAMCALSRGVSTLIELPACGTVEEAATLARAAAVSAVTVQCAQTSRYLEPFRCVRNWIASGRLGDIRQIHYVRMIPPRRNGWVDDALLHHAAHPLDLFLHWFGSLTPLGCAAVPLRTPPQDCAVLAQLPGGAPVSVSISYTATLAAVRMTVMGANHTIATDGFSFIECEDATLAWKGDGQTVYEQAVGEQDLAFLECCRTGRGGIPWSDTVRLAGIVEHFRNLCLISEPIS